MKKLCPYCGRQTKNNARACAAHRGLLLPIESCPYCGYKIKHEEKACWNHRDLLALDLEQTGWAPR